jgi:hypothetical protein
MIAASVQCDVDGIPKGSHYVRVPTAIGRPNCFELTGDGRRTGSLDDNAAEPPDGVRCSALWGEAFT